MMFCNEKQVRVKSSKDNPGAIIKYEMCANNQDKLFEDNNDAETYLDSSQIWRVFEAVANRWSDRWWSTAL